MKLKTVEIVNFRSIKEATIEISPPCRALLGINESGKSNILRAFSFLGDVKPEKKLDLRQNSMDENVPDDSFVRFIFDLFEEDIISLEEESSKVFLCNDIKSTPLGKIEGKNRTLLQLCRLMKKSVFSVYIKKPNKQGGYYSIKDSEKHGVEKGWSKIAEACPGDFKINFREESVNLKTYKFIYLPDFAGQEIPSEYLATCEFKDINAAIGNAVCQYTRANLPEVITWKFEEKSILPHSVDISGFQANPDKVSQALKSMFELSGYSNVNSAIAEAIENDRLPNMLKMVSRQTTKHFKSIWKDYKNIKFVLKKDGNSIDISVQEDDEDAAEFRISQRSDGFKRFVSFLLLISAKVKSGNLQNILLLADEPDISLHPSGARYLRDELIKISKSNNNVVVFSTHSIFMIDKQFIARHIIVKKTKDITTIESAGKSDFKDEEVLFNALNTSIYEIMQSHNILFEGWRDQKLFKAALKKAGAKPSLSQLKKAGCSFSAGVNVINHYANRMDILERKYVIFSDADKPAIASKKKYESAKFSGKWFTVQNLGASKECQTGEDFVSDKFYEQSVLKIVKNYKEISTCPDFTKKPRMRELSCWLDKESGIDDQTERNNIKDDIKSQIFENLKPKDVEDSYLSLLPELEKHLFGDSEQESEE